LLSEFGEDVAGAVQFVTPDREEYAVTGGEVRWLSDTEFDQRLSALQDDAANTRLMDDPGRFSLAGAQSKMALLEKNGHWGVPSGRIPTNRIVKLASGRYDGLLENEHFCIELMNAVGLNTVRSRVINRRGITAIVVDRYDRIQLEDGSLARVHQEDMCQANSVHPQSRYENEGGPGVGNILTTLNASRQPVDDREAFVRAQIVNFLLGGTDAHAKNFSILLGEHGDIRLAPFYDVASLFPYHGHHRCRLAMRIGGSYDFDSTLPRHWAALGRRLGGKKARPVQWLEEYAIKLPDCLPAVADAVHASGVQHEIIGRLVDTISESCERTLNQITHYRNS
ncbi:MAG: HipA domain-containing protein, partial [Gammaproteobacteria bacterium]|jgi:serine/threonine-protein kinase HipA